MAAQNEIKYIITADGSGLDAATRKAEQNFKGFVSNIKQHWIGFTAAIAGTGLAFNKAFNLAEMAAKFEQSRQAFRSMVTSMGQDAEQLFQDLKQKSAGLIGDQSLVEAANRAFSLGIPVERLGELMEISRAKARDMGITTAQAFDDIATGVGRGSPLIIDNLGLALKLGEANEKFAASVGKTVEELTEKEKKLAILNATVDAGKEALDRYDLSTKTMYERMQSLRVTVENMELQLGALAIRVGVGFVGAFELAKAAVLGLGMALVYPVAMVEKFLNIIGVPGKTWQDTLDQQSKLYKESVKGMEENFRAMMARSEDLVGRVRPPKSLGEGGSLAGAGAVAAAAGTDWLDQLRRLNAQYEQEEARLLERIRDMREKVVDDIKRLTLDEFSYREHMIGREYDRRKEVLGDSLELEEWYSLELMKIASDRDEQAYEDMLKSLKLREETVVESFSQLQESLDVVGARMTYAFQDFFDYTSKGFMDFGELAKRILHGIYEELIDVLIVKQIVGSWDSKAGTGSGIIGVIGSLFSKHSGGLVMHAGGLVPSYHYGGLASDERPAVLQTGEYVMSRRGVAALDRINSGELGATNNYYYIQAVDPQSFSDLVERNPGAIQKVLSDDKRRGGHLWRQ